MAVSRTTLYRIARGESEAPIIVAKLLDMYGRHGVPEEHKL